MMGKTNCGGLLGLVVLVVVANQVVRAEELSDSLAAVLPRSIQVQHGERGDGLQFDPAAAETVWFVPRTGYEYGTIANFLVSWMGGERYICGTEGGPRSGPYRQPRLPEIMVLSPTLRDSLVGDLREVILDLSVVGTEIDSVPDPRPMPRGWDAHSGEVAVHRRLTRTFRVEAGLDSLHFRLMDPPN